MICFAVKSNIYFYIENQKVSHTKYKSATSSSTDIYYSLRAKTINTRLFETRNLISNISKELELVRHLFHFIQLHLHAC